MANLTLYFGKEEIPNGSFVPLDISQTEDIRADWDKKKGKKYAIVLYDPDANYLHWIVDDGTRINTYIQPEPPAGEKHEYILNLYEKAPGAGKILSFTKRTDFLIDGHDDFGKLIDSTSFISG